MATLHPLDIIRQAAVERLCIDLQYNGSRRIVEPYSLRITNDGNLLLCARKKNTDRLRTYRVDRIEDAQLTQEHFHPLYAVEMTAGGPLGVRPPVFPLR